MNYLKSNSLIISNMKNNRICNIFLVSIFVTLQQFKKSRIEINWVAVILMCSFSVCRAIALSGKEPCHTNLKYLRNLTRLLIMTLCIVQVHLQLFQFVVQISDSSLREFSFMRFVLCSTGGVLLESWFFQNWYIATAQFGFWSNLFHYT